jgi:hypothetical protein
MAEASKEGLGVGRAVVPMMMMMMMILCPENGDNVFFATSPLISQTTRYDLEAFHSVHTS